AIGATLPLGDREFTVIGVARKGFTGMDFAAPDLWIPMSSAKMGPGWEKASVTTWLRIFARVRRDVPVDRAGGDAMRIAREAAPNAFFTGKDWEFRLVPIMRARASEQGTSATVMTLLGAMSLIVLLIAC